MHNNQKSYLDFLARSRQAFRPFAPIDLPQFFQGRRDHVDLLRSELATPGRQVAIYGERGVGKTSLAMLAYFFANRSDEKTFFVRCEQGNTYERIFGDILLAAGAGFIPNGIETETRRAGTVGAAHVSVSKSKTARSRHHAIESARAIGPAMLLSMFKDENGLLILDEYDRVSSPSTHTRLAETLKHFSDAASTTKIIVVGVAETLADLIGEHASLTRCLAQIKLGRMDHAELEEIITAGEQSVGVVFKDNIRQRIIVLSDGFPFYTHLLCKYCTEDAANVLTQNPDARAVVSETEYKKALQRAIRTGEGTLQADYQAAVITVKRKTEMFKHVLWAIAYVEAQEVQVQEIAQNVGLLTGDTPKIESLSNYLGALIKPEKQQVLTRVRQGYYRFSNPLMRAYVRLILEEHNILVEGGQLQFPWMRAVGELRDEL